ncbi:PfkB family carbohydrate kinase [Krasilnikovia sp. MM14-A1259]|uniref:PfkB family carbohydrate kinase n=1 Tax=Krasilnikovia sp. MM14-A1259 TaxID=3373539 RepID=UPI00381A72B9
MSSRTDAAQTGTEPVDVCIVGVACMDLLVQVPALPGAGETVFGELQARPGGKGFNQALAAAAAGARTALVAQAGDDDWGHQLRQALHAHHVDTSGLVQLPGATAAVVVQVPPDGDSAVTVTRTPTTLHRPATIVAAAALLARATVTVIQLELDAEVIAATIAAAGGRTIGTLAPPTALPEQLLAGLDILMVNAVEAATLLGDATGEVHRDPTAAALALARKGPAAVITLGAAGAVYATPDGHTGQVASPPTRVVDTTGAGDAALGHLAAALARDLPLADAVTAGVAAGSRAVSRLGATD